MTASGDAAHRPEVSVFTPSNDPRWLADAYDSLARQSFVDWEWVVVLNGGAPRGFLEFVGRADQRVRVHDCHQLQGVGAAKSFAADRCRGRWLVELDHDDVLESSALGRVARFRGQAGFVYSDGAQVDEHGERDDSRYNPGNGWEYREVKVDDREVLALRALEPTPHNVSYIWWAPNHLRAFTRAAYDAAGGYDHTKSVADDADLMCRLFKKTSFARIPRCLYLQRIHAGNTQRRPEDNAAIQVMTVESHDRHIEGMCLAWAKRNSLLSLDLGGAHDSPEGFTSVDLREPADVVGDVFDVLKETPDSSVGVIRANDFLEHIPLGRTVPLMNEVHRVLAPDGMLLSETPSTDGRGAFQDPTHVSFWNENSFWYYTRAVQNKYVPDITARFQTSRLTSHFPSEWHRANNIPYVRAHLVALKNGGARNGGIVEW